MKYELVLREKALDELHEAYFWYEDKQKGLGERFLKTANDFLKVIQKNPHSFKTTYRIFREVWLRKFPFLIVYFKDEKKNKIVIVSVFHTSRNPKSKLRQIRR
jgi:plasmid stabilization system protein ParE